MKLSPANFKSKLEMVQALLAGDVLYHNGDKVFFDALNCNPFRIGNSALDGAWSKWDKMLREQAWYEDLARPVPCTVWDDDRPVSRIRWVVAYKNGRYRDTEGDRYQFAEPLTRDDILEGFE